MEERWRTNCESELGSQEVRRKYEEKVAGVVTLMIK